MNWVTSSNLSLAVFFCIQTLQPATLNQVRVQKTGSIWKKSTERRREEAQEQQEEEEEEGV